MTTVKLAYGRTGLDLTIDPAVTTVVTPVHHPVSEDPRAVLRRALREPVAGPPLRERVRPGQTVAISACDGTRPQPRRADDPRDPRRAGRHRAARRRRGARRDRHPPRQHRRRTAGDVRRRRRRQRPDRQPRRPRPRRRWPGCGTLRRRRAGLAQPRRGSTPTSGSPPASSSRTSSPGSPAAPSSSPRAWPAWRPCWCCTTPPGSATPRATWGITEGNPVHDDVRAIAAATGVTFALRRDAQPGQGHRRRVRRRPASRCTPPPCRGRAGWRCGRCRHRSTSWSPPTRATRSTRTSTRRSRACRPPTRSPSRAARSSARPSAATVSPTTAPTGEVLASARSPRALLAEIAARPVTVPDQWQVQIQAQIQARQPGRDAHLLPQRRGPGHRAPGADPATSPRPWPRRSPPPGPARGCASCPKARRPSPTSQRHGEKAR